MLKNTVEITTQTLLYEAAGRLAQGYRFVTVTCLDGGDHHEIYYHFDKNYELLNLRLLLPRGTALPSVSHVCFAAVIVENELQDLFGIKVEGLVADYGGRMLLTEDAPKAPLNKTSGRGEGILPSCNAGVSPAQVLPSNGPGAEAKTASPHADQKGGSN